jgi:subtilisin family serine protease
MARVPEPNDLNSAALLSSRTHPSLSGLDGRGVVICVIDYGFDLVHPAFRTDNGETRFAALIDQNGSRLGRAEINRLLRAVDRSQCRDALDNVYDPHANYFGKSGVQIGAHGSWVASIAAGTQTAEFCGVAPNATLIGVQLDLPDSAWREEDANGRPTWLDAARNGPEALSQWQGWRDYENNPAIVAALDEGFSFACSLRPDGIVFNLSIGSWAGGHDNGSAVNRKIQQITDAGKQAGEPMTAVVTGTGNAGADEGHIGGHVSSDHPLLFKWWFPPGSRSQSKLEIWTDCAGDISVQITPDFGDRSMVCRLVESQAAPSVISLSNGRVMGIGDNYGPVRNGLRRVRLLLQPSLVLPDLQESEGCGFDVAVQPMRTGLSGVAHAWLERDCVFGPVSKLINAGCRNKITSNDCQPNAGELFRQSTLTSLACAPSVIAVAGLDNAAADCTAMAMSGCGPRPWNGSGSAPESLPAPLLAAPARGLFGARSKTAGYMRGSGTSGAAAIVSGASAIAMQAADLAGLRINTAHLASILTGSPIDWEAQHGWRPDLGLGALNFDASQIVSRALEPEKTVVLRRKVLSDERTIPTPN